MTTRGIRARRPHKGGRPHKGARHLFQSRVPIPLAETVMSEADAAGLSYSEFIAQVLAEKYGYNLPIERTASDNSVQEELAMQTAS